MTKVEALIGYEKIPEIKLKCIELGRLINNCHPLKTAEDIYTWVVKDLEIKEEN